MDDTDNSSFIPYALSLFAPKEADRLSNLLVSDSVGRAPGESPKKYSDYELNQIKNPHLKDVKVNGKPLLEFMESKGIKLRDGVKFGVRGGDHYDPRVKEIRLGLHPKATEYDSKGTLGHELGHAVRDSRNALMHKRYVLSKKLTRKARIPGILMSARKDVSGKEVAGWTALSMLTAAPLLHEEVQASREGSKLIGLKGLKRLHSFRGLPSYLTWAAAPAIAYGARQSYEKLRGLIDRRGK